MNAPTVQSLQDQAPGLVLTGGGARGAYQVGVLSGLYDIVGGRAPLFSVLTGVSAGAVNAAYLAAYAENWGRALAGLERFWSELRSEQVYKTDLRSIGRIGAGWLSDVATAGTGLGRHARSLLDTSPLNDLIAAKIPFDRIPLNLRSRQLSGLAVAATDLESTENVTYYMSQDERVEPWVRTGRAGTPAAIEAEHVMASAAIPLLFPPVNVRGRFLTDGCLRHAAPLSAALHLGASRLVVVGARMPPAGLPADARDLGNSPLAPKPSIARTLSVIINAVLLEAVELDLERAARINRTLALISEERKPLTELRQVDCLYIHPSEDLAAIAAEEMHHLPAIIRYLLRGLGPADEAAGLASYLLFEPGYCRRLLALGRKDAAMMREEIEAFFAAYAQPDVAPTRRAASAAERTC